MMNLRTRTALPLLLAGACLAVAPLHAQKTAAAAAGENIHGLSPSYLDTSADPCGNFYQYACGNFSKVHPLPSDHARFDIFDVLFDENEKALHQILDKYAAAAASRTANEQKIGDYYATCLDTAAINQKGLTPLQAEFDRIDALKDKNELPALLAHMQLINVGAFLGFGEQQDFKDARKQIAVVSQGGLGLPERDYYLRTGAADEKIRQQYVEHIGKMLQLMGEPAEKAAADAKKIMDLETSLAKVSLDITSQRDPKNIYHLVRVADVDKMAPSINWAVFFKGTGAPQFTELNVMEPDFLKGMNAVIESTPLDTLKTYLKWQVVNSVPSTSLPDALDQEHFNFYSKELNGQPEQRLRWKRCISGTDGALGEALGQIYVKQAFPPSSKAATQQMVRDIEAAMEQDVDTLEWMSPETKIKAKAKLHAVANKIGYPEKWRDYSTLNVVRGDAMGNAARAAEFENRRQLNKIGKPVDRGEFGMSPPTVNAYYDPSMNDINFPAGILQPPFYDPTEPDAVNYGHIGAVVGHELTHGFDDQGRQFDGAGNLADWWTVDDGKKFDEKADCEVKEYGNFAVEGGVHINGKLTLGENTADNGGIRLAYMAYLEDAKRKSVNLDEKRNGYTPLQEFFLAYAQNWCGEMRPEAARTQVQTDPHSPDEFRVNGVIQNMGDFSKAFNCKAGTPMVPTSSCRVW